MRTLTRHRCQSRPLLRCKFGEASSLGEGCVFTGCKLLSMLSNGIVHILAWLIPVPAFLPHLPRGVTVCEVTVGARPIKVFDHVFNADSPYRAKMVSKEVSIWTFLYVAQHHN